ncbi:MAG: transcriptional repressor [Nitrospirae bacterium]|nr:transcriptional repressor [Nitrospirota bacterium]MBF0540213.1 transcriptional repressor [Nitrospirota bacterium]
MLQLTSLYNNIRASGGRITKIRREILQKLADVECLISHAEILQYLNKIQLKPDRSTIFRELLFLVKNNIIIKTTILGVDYYEIRHDHHHHLICLRCNVIEKVEICSQIEENISEIARNWQFNVINHTLEFYGYCRNCRVED